MVGFLGCAALVLLYSPSSFWLFLRKKGLPQKVLMRTSQQFRFFLEGEYLKRFFFYFNVGNFPMFGFGALFKRAAIFTTPLNLMDFFS